MRLCKFCLLGWIICYQIKKQSKKVLHFDKCQQAFELLCLKEMYLTTGVELHAGYGFVMSWEVSHHSLPIWVLAHQDLWCLRENTHTRKEYKSFSDDEKNNQQVGLSLIQRFLLTFSIVWYHLSPEQRSLTAHSETAGTWTLLTFHCPPMAQVSIFKILCRVQKNN